MVSEAISGGIPPRGFSSKTDWPWPLVKAKDLVTLNYGKALLEKIREPGEIPVYGTNGICGWSNRQLSNGPGVILGRKGQGPLGVEWCDSPFWVIDTAYHVTIKDDRLRLRFFYNLVKFIGLNHLKDGTSNPSLSRDTFAQLLLPLPPLDVQDRISDILEQLDRKIALNGKMNKTLWEMARALFQSWFVDFDPTRAKLQGGTLGLPDETAQLFPDAFEDSPMGEIPAGWTVERIGDLAEVAGGTTPNTKQSTFWNPETHPWATPKDLSNLSMPVLLSTERQISDAGLAQIGSGLMPRGTVLLSSRAPIGYLAIAELPLAINQGFIAMKARKDVSNLFLLLWAHFSLELIKSRANGSTFLEISKSNFRVIETVRPTRDVMTAFDRLVRPLYERIANSERESFELAASRDLLLPRLISGELKLRPVEGEG